MFAKYALAARIAPRKAPLGGARIVLAANRPRRRVMAVWQRNRISGRIELRWRPAAETGEQRGAEDGPSRRIRPAAFIQPRRRVA